MDAGARASSKACDQESRNRRQSCRRGSEVHRGQQETRALVELEWIEDEEELRDDSLEVGDGGLAWLCEHHSDCEMVNTVATRCLSFWLVAWSRVGQERTPKENNDEEMQFRLQQRRHTEAGDVQANGNHAVRSWRRSASGIARVLGWSDTVAGGQVGGRAGRHRHVRHICDDHGIAGTGGESDSSAVQSAVDALCGTI